MSGIGDLHGAIDDPAALRRLIAAGADLETRDDWDCTPLFQAVVAGVPECVDLLIEAGADVNAVAGEPGRSIMAAVPWELAMQCAGLLGGADYDRIVRALEAAGAKPGPDFPA